MQSIYVYSYMYLFKVDTNFGQNGSLNLKNFLGDIPPDPLEVVVFTVRLACASFPPPPPKQKILYETMTTTT